MSNKAKGTVVASVEDTSAEKALVDLYAGSGVISEDAVTALVEMAVPAIAKADTLEVQVREQTDAIDALTQQRNAAIADREVAQVTVARIAFLLTSKEVRGKATMTQGALADRLGIHRARVNQYATVGAALYAALGTPKKEVTGADKAAFKTLETARRDGAATLKAVVETVKANAAAAPEQKRDANAVRVAHETVKEAKRTEPVVVTVKSQHARLSSILDTLTGADDVTGTPEEVEAALAIAQKIANALRAVNAAPKPEPKPKRTPVPPVEVPTTPEV